MKKVLSSIKDFFQKIYKKITQNKVLYIDDKNVKIFDKSISWKLFKALYITLLIVVFYLILLILGTTSLFFVLRRSIYIIVPLILVAFGGLYSERSGVVNIALEGMMVFGAFIGIVFMVRFQDSSMNSQLVYLIGIVIAGLAGMIFSLIHAFASINMKANQIISGTALNLLAPAFALFFIKILYGGEDILFKDVYFVRNMGFLSDIPVLGPILFQSGYLSTFYTIIIIIVAGIFLYKTRIGLRLRACGEHPHAADAAGINVAKMRYFGVMISGTLAGIGGLLLVIPLDVAFRATASGYGFLALAVLISGQWKPYRIIVVAVLFGFMLNLSGAYQSINFLRNAGLPDKVYSMIPFILTLIVLAFTSKTSQAPRAAGEPFDPGKR
jgi:general nucleoside transport system permease protein